MFSVRLYNLTIAISLLLIVLESLFSMCHREVKKNYGKV